MCVQPTIRDFEVAKSRNDDDLRRGRTIFDLPTASQNHAQRRSEASRQLRTFLKCLQFKVLHRFVGPADGGVHPVQGEAHPAPGGSQKSEDASDV